MYTYPSFYVGEEKKMLLCHLEQMKLFISPKTTNDDDDEELKTFLIWWLEWRGKFMEYFFG